MSAKRSRMKRKGTADGMLKGSQQKLAKRLAKLKEVNELVKSGNAGLDRNMNVVDRRQVPTAVPMRRNGSEW